MKSNPARIASYLLIFIFLGSAAFIGGSNAHLFSVLPGLQENATGSMSQSSGYSVGYSHYNFVFTLSIADSNPLSQWSSSNGNSYVISVPSGSTFSQYIQPHLTFYGEFDYHGSFGETIGARTFTVTATETTTFTPYSAQGTPYNPITLARQTQNANYVTGSSGNGPQYQMQFKATTMNYNQTNQYNAMFGVIQVSVSVQLQSGTYTVWNPLQYTFGQIDQTQNGIVSGQMYVFPGTGTLNIPNPQSVVLGNGNYTTISGTMNYGHYWLAIGGPGGFLKNYDLGTSTGMGHHYSIQFVPPEIGNYTVVLSNSVVALDYQNVFGVNAVFNTPTIIIQTPSSSGYYNVNETIDYTVTLHQNTSLPVEFIINVWDGQSNQQTTNQAYQIIKNELVHPSMNLTTHQYQYSGSFEINTGGAAEGYVTITASAYYYSSTTNTYVRSVNPGVVTIEVSPPVPPPVHISHSYLGYLEGFGVLGLAGVAAYKDPETTGIKFGIIASAAILAAVLIGVI